MDNTEIAWEQTKQKATSIINNIKQNIHWFGALCGAYLTVWTPTNLSKGKTTLRLIKTVRIKSAAEIKVSK